MVRPAYIHFYSKAQVSSCPDEVEADRIVGLRKMTMATMYGTKALHEVIHAETSKTHARTSRLTLKALPFEGSPHWADHLSIVQPVL
jgi:hypothetical protein